jgi:FkbM family methyltransferase
MSAPPGAYPEGATAPLTDEAQEILWLLDEDAPTYIVEVGAHDGVSQSTSLPLAQAGWHAILVEPHPEVFKRLAFVHGVNPNVFLFNGACGPEPATMKLHIGKGDNTMLSSLVTDDNAFTASVRTGETVDVEVKPLRDLLRKRKWPEDYGVLLVDTEGFDAQVLQAGGLRRWRPRVLVTEEYVWNLDSLRAKHQLLWRNGYAPFKRTGDNMIWVRQDIWDETLKGYVRRRDGLSVTGS